MENNVTLPENMIELMNLIKSRANEDNSDDEVFGLAVASSFDSEGEVCNELIDHMIGFIKTNTNAGISEIFDHLVSVLPPVEIVDDDEDESA
ncbi:MAG: hypothetical protein IJ784_05050 [Ruminiclostridium sp.]|nr:hypothetical protein [Ruminiclostridium sp.]